MVLRRLSLLVNQEEQCCRYEDKEPLDKRHTSCKHLLVCTTWVHRRIKQQDIVVVFADGRVRGYCEHGANLAASTSCIQLHRVLAFISRSLESLARTCDAQPDFSRLHDPTGDGLQPRRLQRHVHGGVAKSIRRV